MTSPARSVKAILVGNTAVGKTSLLQALCLNAKANPDHDPTVAVALATFTYQADGYDATIQFWDTAGQEKYNSLSPVYLVFALNDRESFNSLEKWTNQVRDVLPDVPIILIGNKSDLEEEPPLISNDEIEAAKERFGFANYQRTSASELTGIQEIVRGNIERIWSDSTSGEQGVIIGQSQRTKGCCREAN